ncbi:PQQ-binding-like beta-propeller repeat protein [Ruania rhizosphaerae]|uniref:outer membrane protein assembly factor BamB family protein n=1 Tax=Ruania rhizosphaerae TaxID=1840413 RepID=UPI001358A082|nr:PQQ-binding-like beta-propeller repeat protein [Ruania rhizosphaerae]
MNDPIEPQHHGPPMVQQSPPQRPETRRRWLIPVIAVAVVLVLGAVAAVLLLPRLLMSGAVSDGSTVRSYPDQPSVAWTIDPTEILGDTTGILDGEYAFDPDAYSVGPTADGTVLVAAQQFDDETAVRSIVAVDSEGGVVWQGPRSVGETDLDLGACRPGSGRIACAVFAESGLISIAMLDDATGAQVAGFDIPYEPFRHVYDSLAAGGRIFRVVPLESGAAIVGGDYDSVQLARVDDAGAVLWQQQLEGEPHEWVHLDVADGEIVATPAQYIFGSQLVSVPWRISTDSGEVLSAPAPEDFCPLPDGGVIRTLDQGPEMVTGAGEVIAFPESSEEAAFQIAYDDWRGEFARCDRFALLGDDQSISVYNGHDVASPVVLNDASTGLIDGESVAVVHGSDTVEVLQFGQELRAYDAETGMRRWTILLNVPPGDTEDGASPMWIPTDGNRIIVPDTSGGQASIVAYSLNDGSEQWTLPLPDLDPASLALGRVGEFLTVNDGQGRFSLIQP